VKTGRVTTLLAAAGLALSPIAANAAASLSIAHALPSFQDDTTASGEDNTGGGSTAVIIGVVLIVLLGAAAISGNGHEVANSP
jgi:hypothetical protein